MPLPARPAVLHRTSDAAPAALVRRSHRARCHLRRHDDRGLRARRVAGPRTGAAVIVLSLVSALLAVAAIVYLVIALLRPERF